MSNENTRGAVGHCLEIHDLLASKYVGNREKDRRFCLAAIRGQLCERGTLLERIATLPFDDERRQALQRTVSSDFVP